MGEAVVETRRWTRLWNGRRFNRYYVRRTAPNARVQEQTSTRLGEHGMGEHS